MQTTLAERKIYSVSQLTENIKSTLEDNFPFIWITGEISNFKSPVSGHYYFTLKDSHAQINAIMFRGQNRNLKFSPDDGMKITGFGRISVYQPRGVYQIIMEYLEPAGIGALQAEFEQLKSNLSQEGLFDEIHKKKLPFLPEKIYLITSPTGSVVHDMIRVLHRRFPDIDIIIIAVKVQGDGAVNEIVDAIRLLNTFKDADIAIIARGGGSLEDLQAFNSEKVARAIFESHVPVISAIGHETDYTISDFVADLRAPTPSVAAELAAPVKSDLLYQQTMLKRRLFSSFNLTLENHRRYVENLKKRLLSPQRNLDNLKIRLDDFYLRLVRKFNHLIGQNRERLSWRVERLYNTNPSGLVKAYHDTLLEINHTMASLLISNLKTKRLILKELAGRLNTLSPTAVLDRGYSITRSLSDKTIILNSNDVLPGQLLEIILSKGLIVCRVERGKSNGKKKDV